MSRFIGRFYFELTDSKNLVGEFSNNLCDRNSAESGDRIPSGGDDGSFVGEYNQTWYETSDPKPGAVAARLKIERKPSSNNIFRLTWWFMTDGKTPESEPVLRGEAILCDGKLIGDYRNFSDL